MIKKHFIPFFILIAFCSAGYSQQLPQYTQYLLNSFAINPAIAGTKPYFEGKSDHRYQWVGITDSPRTYVLSVDGPTRNQKMGLGGYLFTDIVGPTRRSGAYFAYAYHVKFSDKWKLSLALSGGILEFTIDGSEITLHDAGDALITDGVQSSVLPDAGFGAYLYNGKFYLGASAPQLFHNRIKFFKQGINPEGTLVYHYYVDAGYKFHINDDFTLEPSVLAKYVAPVPLQVEGNLKVIYKNKVWLGATYRTEDAIAATLGYDFKKRIIFGYSYDYAYTDIQNYSSGTHEIMIGLRFGYLPSNKNPSASMQ